MTVRELQSLASGVSEDELAHAKSILRLQVLRGLEMPGDRLEESLRNLRTYGKVVHQDYLSWIDGVTTQDVTQAVSRLLDGQRTFVAFGGQVSSIRA